MPTPVRRLARTALVLFTTIPLPAQFTAPQSVPGVPYARAPAVGDVNLDGIPDLICCASGSPSQLAIARGTGARTFAAVQLVAVPASVNLLSVIAGDVNGDQKPDLVTTDGAGTLFVLFGDGLGGFAAGPAIAVPSTLHVVLGDVNRDGHTDLVTANSYSVGQLAVLFGNGLGSFGAPIFTGPFPGNVLFFSVALVDFDGDGWLDAVCGDEPGDRLMVLRGDGTGHFPTNLTFPVGSRPMAAQVDDLDHDLLPDAVTANRLSGTVSVLRRSGATFLPAVHYPVAAEPRSLRIGDVNGDGHADLVTTSITGARVSVLLGDGSGGFTSGPIITVGLGTRGAVIADLDLDGRPDVVTANQGGNDFSVLWSSAAVPVGITAYGNGTPGCGGMLGMGANVMPAVNTPGFAILCSNAPPQSFGIIVLGGPPDVPGSDPFLLGFRLHLMLGFMTTVFLRSDAAGATFHALGIPDAPTLAGLHMYAQTLWLANATAGDTCSPAVLDIVTSRGLDIHVQ